MKKELKKAINRVLKYTKDFNTLDALWSEKHPDCDIAKLRREVMSLQNQLNLETVKHIELEKELSEGVLYRDKVVKYVSVRPCGKEYENKTYLGVFVGEFPLGLSYRATKTKLCISLTHRNPAIFIPELGKTVMGCESWWENIESAEKLKQITDDDINNVWYVQALKQLTNPN